MGFVSDGSDVVTDFSPSAPPALNITVGISSSLDKAVLSFPDTIRKLFHVRALLFCLTSRSLLARSSSSPVRARLAPPANDWAELSPQ